MKKLLFTLLVLLCVSSLNAQMDERFYYPKKTWTTIDAANFREQNYFIDKDTINSIVLNPTPNKPKATIIYFHGAGGNVSSYVKFVKPLADDGFQVIMLDMRGYGKSTGKPTHVTIASDAQIIFNTILQNNQYKHQKIIIYGSSMGTQVAVNLAKNNQNKIAGLVLDGVISSFTDIAADTSPKESQDMIRNHLISPYSAKNDIKELKTIPVLFIHSREDKSVPFSHFETVYNNTTTKKEQWIYIGDHLMAPVTFKDEFVKKVNSLIIQ
ncbi:MAG TPA: alpha/beta fold hydrolase [Flavobacterium sp.]|jgi:hypothetical protein